MKRYKLTIAYDGTGYKGWQRQPEPAVTVQREVERAAGSIVSHPVTVQGVSRTDTGVHALGQVAAMNAETSLDVERLRKAINSRLPKDILVRELVEAGADFDVRRAVRKRYRYLIWADKDRPILQRSFVYHYYRDLDIGRMQAACKDFVGTHDFEAFRGHSEPRDNTVRTMFSCGIRRRAAGDPLVLFAVEGSGFLYHMVRTMVGTLLEIGSGKRAVDCIPGIIATRDREEAGACAPAQGLCLQWVRF